MNYINKIFIFIILMINILFNINICKCNIIKKNKIELLNKNILNNKNILIKNNVFVLKINKKNGNLKYIKLIKYNKKYKILKKKNNNFLNLKIKNIIYKKKKLLILLEKNKNNIIYKKKIIIDKNSYKIKYIYKIENNSNKKKKIKIIKNLIQKINKDNKKELNISYIIKNDKKINTLNIENIKKINIENKIHWISLFEKYFIICLVNKNNNIKDYIYINKEKKIIKIKNLNFYKIYPKQNKTIKNYIWIGPKLNNTLNKVGYHLDDTINYGILWFICKPLFYILKKINNITNNWGYSIIIITMLIKLITYPINKLQYKYNLKITKIQKKINKIKKKYKDKNIIDKKIIDIYKKNNINPFINLLLIFSQLPIFISMYNILTIPVELQNSKFIFWIKDLSKYDKYFILPIIMSISVYINQIYIYEKKDENYNNLNKLTPIIFGIFSLYFPSGLLIYYIFNNFFTSIQQIIIEKNINKKNEI